MRIPLTKAALEALPVGAIVIPITSTPMPYAFYHSKEIGGWFDIGRDGRLSTEDVISRCNRFSTEEDVLQFWPVEQTDYATLLNRLEAVEAKLANQDKINSAVQDQMHNESLRRQDAELLIRNQLNQVDRTLSVAINTAVAQQQADQARLAGRLDYLENHLKAKGL